MFLLKQEDHWFQKFSVLIKRIELELYLQQMKHDF